WGFFGDGCLAYGPGGYVTGNYHSTDGVHWEQSTVPPSETIIYVADNGSKYLGVTADSGVLASADGASWVPVSDNLPSTFHADSLKAMNGAFFLTGTDGNGHAKVMSSTDGSSWTDVTPSNPAGFHGPFLGYGNGVYVAIGNDDQHYAVIARSDDGAHWTIEADAFPGGLAFYPFSISYGGGEFLAVGIDPVGDYGEYLVSHDGSHWTATDYHALNDFTAVLWDGSKFVATGSNDILNALGVMLNVSGSGPASVEAGADFAYTVSVSNDGDIAADKVVLNDTLATAAAFKSATTSQGTCANEDGVLSCELGTLAAGDTVTLKLTYTAGSKAGSVTNEAAAYAYQPTRDDADTHSSTTVTVKPQSAGDKSEGDTGGGGAVGLFGLAALLGFALRRTCGRLGAR
ncbi:MAG TPA: hypothetical protein VFL54_03455, partial [Gammaproteobacteria bacterium]|nr:hypothetical protein [Gammaproteobacteria bacterium]